MYALIGDNAPSLALAQMQATVKPAFKERKIKKVAPRVVTARTVHWNLTGFTNPARGAGKKPVEAEAIAKSKLKLSHWVKNLPKDHVDGATDNKFSQYNTTSQSYSYSSEEFVAYLRGDLDFYYFEIRY